MDNVTRGLQDVFIFDDILIASGSRGEHKQHLHALLDHLQKAGVVVNDRPFPN